MGEWETRRPDWLTIGAAVERILAAVAPLPGERVPLVEALGRTLAEAVTSPIDQPPWDNSAMDGYAVLASSIAGATEAEPVALAVIEEVPAGAFPSLSVGPGQAIKVMTGAPIPTGADTVVRVEHTDAWGAGAAERGGVGGTVLIRSDGDARRNIRRRGEDLRVGGPVVAAGRVLRPAEIGVLASVGRAAVAVHRKARVAILSNGDELVDLDGFAEVVAGRRIVNSNAYGLAAAVTAAGATPVVLGIAADAEASIRRHVEAAAGCDLLVTSAGASVGEHDLLKRVLEGMGFQLDFWRVLIKPGSPFSFGVLPDGGSRLPVFGLPGNPVSALVTFEVLVRPAILRLHGRRDVHPGWIRVRALEEIPADRRLCHVLRARLEADGAGGWGARLTGPQGSGILTSMAMADALLVVPPGESIPPGADLRAIPLRAAAEGRPDPPW
jgi:molybdopterin molybdotransferase